MSNKVVMYRATIWPLGRGETDPEDVTVYESALGAVYGRLLDELEDFLCREIDLFADRSDEARSYIQTAARSYIQTAAQLAEAYNEEAALSTARRAERAESEALVWVFDDGWTAMEMRRFLV